MAKKSVFYSFHFNNDVMRVQQIRNMGILDGDEPVSFNKWEEIKRSGDQAIKNWIQENMNYRKAVVVLIGEETHKRPWVQYEIKKGWNDGRAVVGIYIHNLNCPNNGKCSQGKNPFDQFNVGYWNMGSIVPVYNPTPTDAYNSIKNNIDSWIDEAIRVRGIYKGTAI
ncbi:TIR domain-containing protein [Larkinella rosea]|uniref:Molecular chaperone Tir n=1 Tax=Larkinella rosea TaxID=2025312 RepID=A0A3P1BC11_9BACT|nr:TIR domain-containing protein [Larkinella rosea]RRA98617.1 molecular chaperone Tir [Larkinella rosea]